MRTSENGIAFIKRNEGYRPQVYNDNGRPAIGYGHDLEPGETWAAGLDLDRADQLLRQDLAERYEPRVNALIPAGALPTQNQFDALVDFDYNLGSTHLATMLHHGWAFASANIPAWCYKVIDGLMVKDAGLLKRRLAEVALFNS